MQPTLAKANSVVDAFFTRHEEDRTEDKFRTEVETYLSAAAERLPTFIHDLGSHFSTKLRLSVQNLTHANYSGLEFDVHVEGDVLGVEYREELPQIESYTGVPPRAWGPWRENKYAGLTGEGTECPSGRRSTSQGHLADRSSSTVDRPNVIDFVDQVDRAVMTAVRLPISRLTRPRSYPLGSMVVAMSANRA